MKYIILFLFLPFIGFSQGGTWPVKYNDSDPSGAPSAAGTRIYFNTATNTLWFWEPAPSSTWRKQPKAFDQITGCAAPAYTPTARQSTFAVNSCTVPELYQWTGAAWVQLNEGEVYTAGAGIDITNGVISNTAGFIDSTDIRTYGAIGDGITDNTIAIQSALNYSKRVHIPKGIFVSQGLTVRDSQFIYGDGAASVIVFKSGTSGYLFSANVNSYTIQDLAIRGLSETSKKTATSSSANRSGIKAWVKDGIYPSKLINLHISGFDSIGISVVGPVIGASGFIIENCDIINTYIGINGYGEYWKVTGSTIATCRYGINVQSANISIVGNIITYCGHAVRLLAGTANNGHGILSSNEMNHNTVTLSAISINTGFTITGNQMFYGNVSFVGCSGLVVSNNTMYCDTLTINGSGENHMTENYFYSTSPVIARTGTGWILKDNFYGSSSPSYIEGAGTALQGGNAFGTALTLGTNDSQKLSWETNNTVRVTLSNTAPSIGINTTSPNTDAGIHVATTNSAILAVGTTAQRPSGCVFGMIRGNSDSTKWEYCNGTSWVSFASGVTAISQPANQFLYGTGTGTTSSSIFTADATNSRIKINTTTPVYLGGISGAGNFPGLWFTGSTPSFTNYNLLYDAGDLILNTITAKSIVYRRNNATWASQGGALLTLSGGVTTTGALGEAAEYAIGQGSNILSMDMSVSNPFIAMSNGTVQVFGALADNTDGAVFGAFSNHPVTFRSGGNFRRFRISAAGGFSFGTTYYSTDAGANNSIFEGTVAVGATSSAASAKVEISSTTQGFLPPRMTTAQRDAIASPATGLTLYCTDCTAFDLSTGVMVTWNGAAWKTNW